MQYKVGDLVRFCGRWHWVKKVNAKSVVIGTFQSIGSGIRVRFQDLEPIS